MQYKKLFFCGIGGSGMLPLAVTAKNLGCSITGSDRSYDAGANASKFDYLKSEGIDLVPQDGMGLTKEHDILVVSAAVEDSIPEVVRAKELSIPIKTRAEVLANFFNKADVGISVAGTSGKSTTTGMIGWCLKTLGLDPTVVNGAPLCNLTTPENGYISSIVGKSGIFVTECCEAFKAIDLYKANIAILTNISMDHMSIEELLVLFKAYLKDSKIKVINIGSDYIDEVMEGVDGEIVTFAVNDPKARFTAENIEHNTSGVTCKIIDREKGEEVELSLNLLGDYNIENALACVAALSCYGIALKDSVEALSSFKGVHRRLETLGVKNDITVIDDFGHNPKKIEASLDALHCFKGRLLILFQMHGYGPLRMMKEELIEVFKNDLREGDKLYMPDVLYLGGTTNKSYTAEQFCDELKEVKVDVEWRHTREELLELIKKEAKAGDRIVVMGARDDTLSEFAKDILDEL